MDSRLYKQQMDRVRPIEQPEFTWWDNLKFTSMGAYLIALPLLLLLILLGVILSVVL